MMAKKALRLPRKIQIPFIGTLVVTLVLLVGLVFTLQAVQQRTSDQGKAAFEFADEGIKLGDLCPGVESSLPRISSKKTNLGLQITPELGNVSYTGRLNLTWNRLSGIKNYVVLVKRADKMAVTDEEVSVSNFWPQKKFKICQNLAGNATSWTSPLTTFGNRDFLVWLIAIPQDASSPSQFQTQTFGYFEDGFEGTRVNKNNWYTQRDVGVSGGKLVLTQPGGFAEAYLCSSVTFKPNINDGFDSSVDFFIISEPSIPSGKIALGITNEDYADYKFSEVNRYLSPNGTERLIRWWVKDLSLAQVNGNVSNGKFKVRRAGGAFNEYYDVGSGFVQLIPSAPYVSTAEKRIFINLCSQDSKPSVSAFFDNFRLIWVK